MRLLLQSLYTPIRPFTQRLAILLSMRRLVVILCALGLLVPATALAIELLPGDGTLVVDNAQGVIVINVRGGVIGRLDQGTIEISDPIAGDGLPPRVYGYQQKIQLAGVRRFQYSGQVDMRFRLIGGLYRVRIAGQGIDVSVVGKGTVLLDGSGFSEQQGRFQLNGGSFQPMPEEPTRYSLAQSLASDKGSDKKGEKSAGPVIPHGQ
jgi:hypothetical protein